MRLHTYVLMPNHYHLQMATPRLNLSEAPLVVPPEIQSLENPPLSFLKHVSVFFERTSELPLHPNRSSCIQRRSGTSRLEVTAYCVENALPPAKPSKMNHSLSF